MQAPLGQRTAGDTAAAPHLSVVTVMADPWIAIQIVSARALRAGLAAARRNARRLSSIVMTLLPIMLLLVGSCKTEELPGAYGSNAGPDQFRIALFPDRVDYRGKDYYPARGYITRAQKYVSGTPDTLVLLTEYEIGYLFGKPALARKDAQARVWQYRSQDCVVDLYFYPDAALSAGRVAHADVRARQSRMTLSPAAQKKCLSAIMAENDADPDTVAGLRL